MGAGCSSWCSSSVAAAGAVHDVMFQQNWALDSTPGFVASPYKLSNRKYHRKGCPYVRPYFVQYDSLSGDLPPCKLCQVDEEEPVGPIEPAAASALAPNSKHFWSEEDVVVVPRTLYSLSLYHLPTCDALPRENERRQVRQFRVNRYSKPCPRCTQGIEDDPSVQREAYYFASALRTRTTRFHYKGCGYIRDRRFKPYNPTKDPNPLLLCKRCDARDSYEAEKQCLGEEDYVVLLRDGADTVYHLTTCEVVIDACDALQALDPQSLISTYPYTRERVSNAKPCEKCLEGFDLNPKLYY